MSTFLQQEHITLAKSRLLEQYKGKPQIEAFLTALVLPLNTLEQALFDILAYTGLSGAFGVQLDALGAIVGIDRQGYGDTDYRLRIKARIFVNVSNGDPETLIQAFKLLSGASLVILQEYFPAKLGLFSDGVIPSDQVNAVGALMELAALGGVKIAALGNFDPSKPFAMEGDLTNAGGFGDTTDLSAGGMFGSLYQWGSLFQFAGDDTTGGGFGSLDEPVVGGRFVSL